jgi:hypothetical protein
MVMPWTWGDFLFMDSAKLDPLKFKATGIVTDPVTNSGNSWWRMQAGNNMSQTTIVGTSGGVVSQNSFEMSNDIPPLGFDNGGNYSYLGNGVMRYVFNAAQANLLGVTNLKFNISVSCRIQATGSGEGTLSLDWSKSTGGSGTVVICNEDEPGIGNTTVITKEFLVPSVPPGAIIQFVFIVDWSVGVFGGLTVDVNARRTGSYSTGDVLHETYFELVGMEKAEGGIVDFKLYDEFKNYKFLDFLRGVMDLSDLEVQTDPLNKIVVFEPAYPYSLTSNPTNKVDGYFKGKAIDWNNKQDLSKESEAELFRDIEQEMVFRYKDDSNDGGAKVFNERESQIAAAAKFIFPDRFKSGKKEQENRFFAPTMHVEMEAWRQFTLGAVAPQIIALVPENISNTSASATENKFVPRVAYYKGIDLYGGEFVNGRFNFNGEVVGGVGSYVVPSMFAVNYKKGGEHDPILSYGDQKVNNVLCHGIMRRFYLPRLAIMSYGKRLKAWYNLTTGDVTNFYHREPILLNYALYHLFNIYGYKPLTDESTQCLLWKYFPVTLEDSNRCYPSISSVLTGLKLNSTDITYKPLLLLQSDIPQ